MEFYSYTLKQYRICKIQNLNPKAWMPRVLISPLYSTSLRSSTAAQTIWWCSPQTDQVSVWGCPVSSLPAAVLGKPQGNSGILHPLALPGTVWGLPVVRSTLDCTRHSGTCNVRCWSESMLMGCGSWQDGSQQKKRASFLLSKTLIWFWADMWSVQDILGILGCSILHVLYSGLTMNSVVSNQFISKAFSPDDNKGRICASIKYTGIYDRSPTCTIPSNNLEALSQK